MAHEVERPTYEIVGPLERFDERDEGLRIGSVRWPIQTSILRLNGSKSISGLKQSSPRGTL